LFALLVKGFGLRALLPSRSGRAIRNAVRRFFNHVASEGRPHAAVACENERIVA
jgi:hypothetical protein